VLPGRLVVNVLPITFVAGVASQFSIKMVDVDLIALAAPRIRISCRRGLNHGFVQRTIRMRDVTVIDVTTRRISANLSALEVAEALILTSARRTASHRRMNAINQPSPVSKSSPASARTSLIVKQVASAQNLHLLPRRLQLHHLVHPVHPVPPVLNSQRPYRRQRLSSRAIRRH